MRKAAFFIGIGIVLIAVLVVLKVGLLTMDPANMRSETTKYITIFDIMGEISFGLLGVSLFNYGFYLIRPD